ncbi:MAG: hypothetical protein E7319_07495 [Clostridiales bacterium]|nr:hypothetical protein [Clostridiales bacterium]
MKKMQKRIALLLSLVLCFILATAGAAEYNAMNIFTISYDENVYLLDNQSYANESTDSYLWLFLMYDEANEVIIDVFMEQYEQYQGLSLFTATTEERTAYVDATLDSLSDMNVKLLDTVTVSDMDIPFYLYYLEDEDGPYLLAETIVGGYAIDFSCYYGDYAGVDLELLNTLDSVLATFTPVV